MRSRISVAIIFFICLAVKVNSQNLVPNPSFELVRHCDGFTIGLGSADYTEFPGCQNWVSSRIVQPDYFNVCSSNGRKVPVNFFDGNAPAHTGQAYGSVTIKHLSEMDWDPVNQFEDGHLYLQNKLIQPLEAGQQYRVSFWIRLADYRTGTSCKPLGVIDCSKVHNIGAATGWGLNLSKNRVWGDTIKILPLTPQITVDTFIVRDGEWHEICGIYTAEGGEEWLTIGNFQSYYNTPFLGVGYYVPEAHSYFSWYFIDDVAVEPVIISNASRDTTVCTLDNLNLKLYAEPGNSSYFWNTGATTSNISVTDTGTYWYRMGTDCGVVTDTIHVRFAPPLDLLSETAIGFCQGGIATLSSDTSFTDWLWSNGDTTPTITIKDTGWYFLSASGHCGWQTDSIHAFYAEQSLPPFVKDTAVCTGATSPQLQVSGQHLHWYLSDTGRTASISQPVIPTHDTGALTLWVSQNETGCESKRRPVTAFIESPPEVLLEAQYLLCAEQPLPLRLSKLSGSNLQLLWNTGAATPVITPLFSGSYWLAAANSCGTASDTTEVLFKDCDSCLLLPDAFTPNGDGRNDVFRPIMRCPYFNFSMRIVNRWGQSVFTSFDPKPGWDGFFGGQAADAGVYFYECRMEPFSGAATQVKRGTITLIR